MEVQTTVQDRSQRTLDPFDAFFRDPFGRNINVKIKSDPLKITVAPLPAGAPAEFRGAVGQFALSASADKRTTRTNEPVSLKITLSGTGNIKLLESPDVQIPPDFEQYTPKVTDFINRTQERISGSKTFEYLVIPRYPGLKVIPGLAYAYFDLAKQEYVKLSPPQIELNVEQGSTSALPSMAGATREDVQLLSQDVPDAELGAQAGAVPLLDGLERGGLAALAPARRERAAPGDLQIDEPGVEVGVRDEVGRALTRARNVSVLPTAEIEQGVPTVTRTLSAVSTARGTYSKSSRAPNFPAARTGHGIEGRRMVGPIGASPPGALPRGLHGRIVEAQVREGQVIEH